MQLKKPKKIRGALATATCALLGTGLPQAAQAEDPSFKDWEFDSAILFYSEKNRVSAMEPVLSARKDLGDDHFLNFKIAIDVLSGSSANGAVPANVAQTFASPSGESSYTAEANETPLDPTFRDTRFAANLLLEKPVDRQMKTFLGLNVSTETDYTSVGVSASLTYDTNNKNTTYSAGAAFNLDTISPSGGEPQPFTEVPTNPVSGDGGDEDEDEGEGSAGKTKNVSDLLLGVTQVISRQTLAQFNYSIGTSSGYLTDPYKLLSVVNPVTGQLVAGSDPALYKYKYYYEKRPGSRLRQNLYWKINHQFTDDVVYLTYRYYWDDWDIQSHTIDLRYRFQMGQHYLQPHLRYYTQTAADFHYYFLRDGEPLPDYASADYRLGELTTTTIGLSYGVETGSNSEFSLRAEYMKQSGNSHPAEAVGVLRNYDLSPDVDAVIVQLSYSYKF